jgi:cytochrome c biogenesis protein
MNRSLSRQFYELLSSMRFAISLLTVLAIASVIGTVLKQNEPYNNYLNQFGQFWFPVFESVGLYSVYHAAWFLAILTFLVASTSSCIIRQAPGMLKEMKGFHLNAKENSLRQFAHQHSLHTALSRSEALERVSAYLNGQRYQSKLKEQANGGVLLAAKAGSWNRMGYLLAHGAIVMICVGGLLDGDMPLKAEMLLGNKKLTNLDQPFDAIGPASRLGPDHWSYRGNVFLPEGKRSNIAVINVQDGSLLQELPFSITLKKFHIEHYSTGMPKRFASDIVVTDSATGEKLERTIEVNKPFEYRGVSLYQASFEDGGSKLKLKAHSLLPGSSKVSDADAEVGEGLRLTQGNDAMQVEITGFRPFNIENMGQAPVAPKSTLENLNKHLGSAAQPQEEKTLKNVGPSFSYKVRDAAGQAHEYNNYMLPVTQEGREFFMTGMRETPADGFRYLRLPADANSKLDTWFALRAIITDPKEQVLIAKHLAAAMKGDIPNATRAEFATSVQRTLELFSVRGFDSLSEHINKSVPADKQEEVAAVSAQVLQSCIWEAWRLLRERSKQQQPTLSAAQADFVLDTLTSISDSFHYGAPVYLELDQFEEIKASVIQATRSPGKNIVYLGCALLVAGVFFMLYVRERRCFVLFKDTGEVLLAFSCNRKTLDTDAEFAQHQNALNQLLLASEPNHGTHTS